MQEVEVPLFPLNTVLFPDGVLPLRIFEPRYLDMVKRCMRDAGEFGVVLLREGREAGSAATFFDVGTLAQVVDFDQLPDKLLGITTRGTRRFRCLEREVQNDGLNVARVALLPPEPAVKLPKHFERYAKLLEQALPQMGDFFKYLKPRYDDATWVSGRLTEVLPIPLNEKQCLLELDDPIERLAVLEPLMRGTVRTV